MDDETRAQYEGFRPGVYVRVEVRLVYVIPFTLFSYYSLSALLRRSWRFPVVPTVDLYALPSITVLCQSTNLARKVGGRSGLSSSAVYSWSRIVRPPGVGLPCVGWYKAYLEIRSPSGRRRQWPRNLICRALTDWERGTVPKTHSHIEL